ncbi:Smr/MutS family protein [Intestinibacillus massiliensis]|uniref:Smr/MutS family protein n=1 Tax=Intestinibacillus massiliensis TaxID=1871029 RepID=UPI000B3561CD|nr:Smr/MutS family protein [Intestinibacillus massiliensis]
MAQNYRIINLEDDLPTVEQAMRRLVWEVRTARKQGIRLLKVIHGFGSSGRGGKIRPAARRELETLQKSGHVRFYIPGERLSIFDADTRRALDLVPALRGDSDLDRHNNGVTLVVL